MRLLNNIKEIFSVRARREYNRQLKVDFMPTNKNKIRKWHIRYLRLFIWFIILLLLLLLYSISKAPALLVTFSFYIIISFIYFIPLLKRSKNLSVKMQIDFESKKNAMAEGKLVIQTKGILPVLRAHVELKAINLFNGEIITDCIFISGLFKREQSILIQTVSAYAGIIRITADNLVQESLFGIFRRKYKVNSREMIFTSPELKPCLMNNEDLSGYDMESFKYSDFKKGNDPGEIYGIREYTAGDSIKSIHWKLSSKMDNLVIRELGFPIENSLLLMVDKRAFSTTTAGSALNITEAEDSKAKILEYLDAVAGKAYSMSVSLLMQGISHYVAYFDYMKNCLIVDSISNRNDLEKWIRNLLITSSVIDKDYPSIVEELLMSVEEKNYAHYLIVGNEDKLAGLEELANYGKVSVFSPL